MKGLFLAMIILVLGCTRVPEDALSVGEFMEAPVDGK